VFRGQTEGSHGITIRSAGRTIRERPARTASYDHQLDAFCGAVIDGDGFPTTAQDALANMTVIDAIYRAAGLEPRQPTTTRE
jgi:predicted dehydrogenase